MSLDTPSQPSVADAPGRKRPSVLAESVVVVLFLLPRLASSFLDAGDGPGFVLVAAFTVVGDAGLVALVWFLLASRGETLGAVGLRPPRTREVALGVVLTVPLWAVVTAARSWATSLGVSTSAPGTVLQATPTVAGIVIGVLLVAVVGITEEALFRGYLPLRLQQAGATPMAAAVISGMLFVLGHGYEGLASVVGIAAFTVFVTAVVWWRRSLTAVIVAHATFDLAAVVVLPLLR